MLFPVCLLKVPEDAGGEKKAAANSVVSIPAKKPSLTEKNQQLKSYMS